jgi:hypothetical protein
MISLDDKRWNNLEGGYHLKYDASIPLIKLERGDSNVESIWSELWENLYHQGDIGVASYAAIPHLTRIVRERGLFDFNPVALTVAVELARGQGQNPDVPDWLEGDYQQALRDLIQYFLNNFDEKWDAYLLKSVLSLVAINKGSRDLGELIFETEEGEERYVLERYASS